MKKQLFAGLIILLPLVITYWIIKFIVKLITGPFEGFAADVITRFGLEQTSFGVPLLSTIFIFLALTAFIIFVGILGHWMVAHSLFRLFEKILHAMPIVNKVYTSSKDFTTALFSPKSDSFSQVVLVPFPSKEHRSIGLVTSQFANKVVDGFGEEFVSVLIPGTPNPTVGFLLMFSRKQLIHTDMRVDEALKYVMSCGSVVPSSMIPSLEIVR